MILTYFVKFREFICSDVRTWHRWTYALILVYITFPYLRLMEAPTTGLDPSWQIGLGMCSETSWQWGRDIVFTYGPLGKYIYRLPIGTLPWQQFVYDLFFFLNLIVFHATCFPTQSKFYYLPLFFLFQLFSFEMFGESTAFLWMLLGIYFGFKALFETRQNFRHLFIILSLIHVTIIFFTKANFGMVVWLFWIVLVLLLAYIKKIKWVFAFTYLLFAFVFVKWVSQLFHTDLFLYVRSNVHIIKAYNDGMSMFPFALKRMTLITYGVFILTLTCSFGSIFLSYRTIRNYQNLVTEFFLILVSLGVLFVLLKYSFLRADVGHYTAFIKLSTYVGVFVISFTQVPRLRSFYLILLPVLFVIYSIFYVPRAGFVQLGIWHGIKYRHFILANYLKELVSNPTQEADIPDFAQLPAHFIQKVGKKSVDVFPVEISWLYFNHLNYVPRPTLQSYVAANQYLDSLNYQHFNSRKAPEFLIYGIDRDLGKYSWAEDVLTQMSIYQNYRIVEQNDTLLLFNHRKNKRKVQLLYSKSKTYRLGDEIRFDKLPPNILRRTTILTSYTMLGQLSNLFFQPPQIHAYLDGSRKDLSVRMTINLLEKGFWSNALYLELDDVANFYSGNGLVSNEFYSMKFVEKDFFTGGYKKEIKVVNYYYRYDK